MKLEIKFYLLCKNIPIIRPTSKPAQAIKSNDPNTVKSVSVVKAYIVSETTIAAVIRAAIATE